MTVTLVQYKEATTTGTGITLVQNSAPTVGNFLLAFTARNANSSLSALPVPPSSENWAPLGTARGGNCQVAVWGRYVVSGDDATWTFAQSSGQNSDAVVMEFSSSVGHVVVGGVSTKNSSGATGTHTQKSLDCVTGIAVAFARISSSLGATTFSNTWNDGFTRIINFSNVAAVATRTLSGATTCAPAEQTAGAKEDAMALVSITEATARFPYIRQYDEANSSAATVTATLPATPVTGNMLLLCGTAGSTTQSGTVGTPPTGFVQLGSATTPDGWARCIVWAKVCDGTDGTSYLVNGTLTNQREAYIYEIVMGTKVDPSFDHDISEVTSSITQVSGTIDNVIGLAFNFYRPATNVGEPTKQNQWTNNFNTLSKDLSTSSPFLNVAVRYLLVPTNSVNTTEITAGNVRQGAHVTVGFLPFGAGSSSGASSLLTLP